MRLIIERDTHTESPLEGSLWNLVSFRDGAEPRDIGDDIAFWLDYFEHGDCRWSLEGEGSQCQWDNSARAGLLIGDKAGLDYLKIPPEDRVNSARNMLNMYSSWLNGYVYEYSLVEPTPPCGHCGSTPSAAEFAGTWSDGWIDCEEMFKDIRSELAHSKEKVTEITGTAAWLAPYHEMKEETA